MRKSRLPRWNDALARSPDFSGVPKELQFPTRMLTQDELYHYYSRLVHSIIRSARWRWAINSRIGYEDLFQQGFLGLIRANVTYKAKLGKNGKPASFPTYAHYWVNQRVGEYVNQNFTAFSTPRGLISSTNLFGPECQRLLARAKQCRSLNSGAGLYKKREGRTEKPYDVVAMTDKGICHDFESVEDLDEWRTLFAKFKPFLTPRMVVILEDRGNGATLQEVADKIGVSRERIRQQEAVALNRIRKHTGRDAIVKRLGVRLSMADKLVNKKRNNTRRAKLKESRGEA